LDFTINLLYSYPTKGEAFMKRFAVVVISCLLSSVAAKAQMAGGPPPDPCAALGKFFARDAAFTATAKVVTTGKKARDNQSMSLLFAVAGRNMRNELDMAQMKGIPAEDLAGMKQMGMDKMVVLKLADKQAAYIVFPGLQSYCDLPAGRSANDGKLDKTAIGKETVEGHPCTKSKLTFTTADGQTAEALVWEATDMKDFPIQYQTVDEGRTTTTTFTDINQAKPAATLFELPASYKKYGTMQEMIMGNMQRLMMQQQ
jgi:hypothetical protein